MTVHGVLGYELYEWIRSRYGNLALLQILSSASKKPVGFVTMMAYEDDDFFAFISGAAKVVQKPTSILLEEFGKYVAPILIRGHKELIPEDWSALDLIEHTEGTIHKVVRRQDEGAAPPHIRCARRNGGVVVIYNSPRKICEFGKGLMTGIGEFFNEELSIRETSCMHQNAPHCEFYVSVRSS